MTAKPSLKRSVTPNFAGGILPMFVALVTTPICLQHISVLRAMVCSPSSGWYRAISAFSQATIADLDRARDALGYRLLSRWSIPDRTTEAPTAKGKQLIESIGEAWTNKAIAQEASPGIDTDTSLSPGF
jgi:hypothetical protein